MDKVSDQQRTALITGASRGIGQACALAIGNSGTQVVGTATTATGAESISALFKKHGITGFGLEMRIDSADSITDGIEQLQKQDCVPDILVNNAGITRDSLLMRMSDEAWSEVMVTNLNSLYYLCKACAKPMIKNRWGRIINISSVSGQMGNPGQSNYAAAKAGMIGFSKSLAKELGLRNITVNCVAPGFIQTDMTASLPEEQREEIIRHIPLGRFGTSEEIGDLVCFLTSDQAAYITGATISINGGMYMN